MAWHFLSHGQGLEVWHQARQREKRVQRVARGHQGQRVDMRGVQQRRSEEKDASGNERE